MRWASAISGEQSLLKAVEAAAGEIHGRLEGRNADLLLVFVSPHHRAVWDALPRLLAAHFPVAVRLGCSGGGIIGGAREIEGRAAISLTAAHLPGVRVGPFHLPPDGSGLEDNLSGAPSAAVLLPDPFSCDVESMLARADAAAPGTAIVGGLASGARQAGENALLLDDRLHDGGAVGVTLAGALTVDTIVAQGCRPIGNPMFVTSADGHLILELDGRRPSEVLHELFRQLSPRDQELLGYSLFLGLVMRADESSYGQGDFLIRNVIGIDPESGVLAVGATPRPNQVVQFHLRDAAASSDDLHAHLHAYRSRLSGEPPSAALLFSCLGRGQGLYGRTDHDSAALRSALGELAIGGFFCSGEIGPVHGRTYLHGYTSSIAIVRAHA